MYGLLADLVDGLITVLGVVLPDTGGHSLHIGPLLLVPEVAEVPDCLDDSDDCFDSHCLTGLATRFAAHYCCLNLIATLCVVTTGCVGLMQ